MLTVEGLKAWGADTAQGLARCMNNEGFYLRLVGMELNDANLEKLPQAVAAGDAKAAFEAAHALKGALGNLALTPVYDLVCQVTELLRGSGAVPDLGDRMERIGAAVEALRRMAE